MVSGSDTPLDGVGWLSFDADSASSTYRTFTGMPTNDEVGDHTLKVSVSDGNGGARSHSFTLRVSNTNDAPTLRETGSADKTVTEAGVNASNAAVAGDAEARGSFTVADLEQTDYANALTIEGRVGSSGGYTAGNRAANGGPNGARGARIAGQYGHFFLTGADASGAIAWSYALDNDCGSTPGIQGSAVDSAETGDPGCATERLLPSSSNITDTLRVRANDGAGNTTDTPGTGQSRYSATLTIEVAITGANDAPTRGAAIPGGNVEQTSEFTHTLTEKGMTGAEFEDVDANDTLIYTASATLPDGTRRTLTASATDYWLTFDVAAGIFRGTPPLDTPLGAVTVTLRATDSQGAFVETSFTLSVLERPNTPPTLTAVGGADVDGDGSGREREQRGGGG